MVKENTNTASQLLAGSIAGLIGDGVVFPIDTLRVRMQTSNQYNSATQALVHIVKNEGGIPKLFKGFGAVAFCTIPAHALYFYGYEKSKQVLSQTFNDGKESTWIHLTSGFLADAFGAIVWCPQDVVKQKLQAQLNQQTTYKNSFQTFSHIVRTSGISGLYQGFGAAILSFGPYVGIYFALYEKLKQFSKQTQQKETLSIYSNSLNAIVASSASAIVTTPFDVVKTRIQVQEGKDYASERRHIVGTLRQLVKEEGYGGLFRGVKPRVLWMASGTALTMIIYEEMKKMFSMDY